jgi:hypothetical protein
MKNVPVELFNELKSQTSRIDVGWLLVRTDGERFAFTSSDIPFVYGGDTYSPTNGFNPSAIISKADFSVDNMECQVLENDLITDDDLRGGKWDLAQVTVFWICRYHPEWGVVILKTGQLGQIVIKQGQWTTQLRSIFEQLQQPFGYYFTLQCMAQLGDSRCRVKLAPPTWAASTQYRNGLLTDASVGDIVKPTTPNGFWYVANYTGYDGIISSPATPPPGNETTADVVPGVTSPSGAVAGYGGEPIEPVSQPGQGLSGNDDLGPNDDTQVAVGAAFDNLQEFIYDGQPVDIFGIKI